MNQHSTAIKCSAPSDHPCAACLSFVCGLSQPQMKVRQRCRTGPTASAASRSQPLMELFEYARLPPFRSSTFKETLKNAAKNTPGW